MNDQKIIDLSIIRRIIDYSRKPYIETILGVHMKIGRVDTNTKLYESKLWVGNLIL